MPQPAQSAAQSHPNPQANGRTQTIPTGLGLNPVRTPQKPILAMDRPNPSQWLNFSLPPRQRAVPGSGIPGGIPRRSRRGDGWRGGALSRERYVHANFRFVLKPTEVLSYGAHFADPDISLHWPHILQVLVPTFSAFSVAQGYVSGDPEHIGHDDEDLGASLDEAELEGMGEEAARVRQRMEEERRGRMCPICLSKPVAGRMTKCGHIFCFPCILHYIRLSDIPGSAKCPICGDTVHEGMLKSVKYLDAASMLKSAKGEDDEPEGSDHTSSPKTSHSQVLSMPQPAQLVHIDHEDHGHGIVGHMDGFEDHHDSQAGPSCSQEDNRDHDHDETPRGHRIHMRLIQRPQMTTMALPSAPTFPSDAIPPHTAPWYFLPDVLAFSRFMLASPEYMHAELVRELSELDNEYEVQKGDELGRDFVRAAREKVERQMGKVRAELMTEVVRGAEREARETWDGAVGGARRERERRKERERRDREREERQRMQATVLDREDIPTEFLATQSHPNPYATIPPNLPVEPNPMPQVYDSQPSSKRNRRKPHPSQSAIPSIPPPQSYYFYQSSLGANVFLHPLDIRILLAHFKSYSLFPPHISFHSTGFDPGTITDELRKRCKYLSHLPLGTEVVFVEAELEELVGKDSLAAFEQPLKARKQKRRARVMKEDKAKVKWERAEREKSGAGEGGVAREEREFMTALNRSVIENTLHGGAGLAPDIGNPAFGSLGSGSSYSPSDSSQLAFQPSTSSGTATWATPTPSRPSFATALHSQSASSVPTPRRLPTRVAAAAGEEREGTAEAEDEYQVQAVWDAAFSNLSLEPDRYGRRGGGRGTVSEGGARDVGGKDESLVGGGGKKGRNKGGRKVLVLGGGGPGTRR